MIVLDASVALSWLFPDELTDIALRLRVRAEHGIVVPAHWSYEIANGARTAERRGRIDAGRIDRWHDQVTALSIEVEPGGVAAGYDLLPLSRVHSLTIYDAAYLDLAQRRRLALATFDKALVRAARSIGIPLATEQP